MNHIIIYSFEIYTCLVMGILLFSCHFISYPLHKLYYQEKIYLGIASLIVGTGKVLTVYFRGTDLPEIFSVPTLFIASTQACIFSFLSIYLFHSTYVNKKNVIKHLLPTVIYMILYFGIIMIYTDKKVYSWKEFLQYRNHPALLFRLLFALTYFIQIIVYTFLFFRERHIFIKKLNNFFSDIDRFHLHWGTRLFFEAGILGIIVLFFSSYPSYWGDIIFSTFLPVFYFVFVIRYINYQSRLSDILVIVKRADKRPPANKPVTQPAFHILEDKLNAFIQSKKPYLTPGIVIADIASCLNVPDRELSYFIKYTYNQNFNTWVNALRIEHAKHLMAEFPTMSFAEIAEQSGFSDKTKFSRVFKEITGILYSDYKKQLC